MNKNELVSAVAEAAKVSKGDAQSAVDAVFAVITGELKKGGDVRLVGFGNFTVSKRAASTGRNPQTGAEVKIPARTVPKFSAGKGLKDAVNSDHFFFSENVEKPGPPGFSFASTATRRGRAVSPLGRAFSPPARRRASDLPA